jgi:outer membrane protein
MKQLKCLLIATLFFLGANQIFAQSKTAHVDVNEIRTKMPAIIEMQKQLEKLGLEYQEVFKTMRSDLQKTLKTYEDEVSKVSEKVNIERQKELQLSEQRIQQYGQEKQKELQDKEMELRKPIDEKIKVAIQKVAKAKGFQYILDSSIEQVILLADGPNLTADVKKELGF